MSKLFLLEIYTPDRAFFRGEVESVTVATLSGRRGFLAGAAPMACALKSGSVEILHNQKWSEAFNTNGFLFVRDNSVTILCDKCRWPHEAEEDSEVIAPVRASSYKSAKAAMAEKLIRE